ncbi:CocE/NonD family hydrolase C-terminal non-catalytic domain-containing protein [Streptomyces sp. NPDC058086]|uniref:CocE/NonD family hydrolase C-terminal non-catalytic domain-containing protein n=1 Tax=Streptomyces sp. NPDC058086 TaxID=3346334 RepID=UPI0036E9E405
MIRWHTRSRTSQPVLHESEKRFTGVRVYGCAGAPARSVSDRWSLVRLGGGEFGLVVTGHEVRSLCFEPDWARITGQTTAGARRRGQTEPAAESVDLAGPVSLELALTATGPSTDLFVKLLDVHPDGEAELVARGRVHLDPPERQLTLSLGHVGHRLRPHVHSGGFPEFVLPGRPAVLRRRQASAPGLAPAPARCRLRRGAGPLRTGARDVSRPGHRREVRGQPSSVSSHARTSGVTGSVMSANSSCFFRNFAT